MARVRMTLDEIAASDDIDRAKAAATTEEDIRRHMIEDGEDPDAPEGAIVTVPPLAALRSRVGLSQAKFAKALRIPAATLRNWEQGRTQPDPVALSFFALVNDDPDRAFKVLAR
jgi:putative transcriptional regulator